MVGGSTELEADRPGGPGGAAAHQLGAPPSDVDDHDLSGAGGAQAGPGEGAPRLVLPAQHREPGSEARAQEIPHAVPVGRVAHGARPHGDHPIGPEPRDGHRVPGKARVEPREGVLGDRPVGAGAAPQSGHRGVALPRGAGGVDAIAEEQPHRVGAEVHDRDARAGPGHRPR
jgi:hypothetical protein